MSHRRLPFQSWVQAKYAYGQRMRIAVKIYLYSALMAGITFLMTVLTEHLSIRSPFLILGVILLIYFSTFSILCRCLSVFLIDENRYIKDVKVISVFIAIIICSSIFSLHPGLRFSPAFLEKSPDPIDGSEIEEVLPENRMDIMPKLSLTDPVVLDSLDKAIQTNPEDANAWYERGLILRRLGHYQDALTSFDKALELNPENTNAQKYRSETQDDLERQRMTP